MEIKPGKRGAFRRFADVRVDSFEEMYLFGAATPILSAEHQRSLNYVLSGFWPGRSFPENYPATIRMPERVLAKTVGKLMISGGGVQPRFQEANLNMVQEITGYFTHTSPSETKRLVSMGKQIVDNLEASHESSPET